MGRVGDETDELVRRAKHIAELIEQISDRRWVTELISTLDRPGRPVAAELVMVEMTIADVERSAQKLLDLRDNLVTEVGEIRYRPDPSTVRSESA